MLVNYTSLFKLYLCNIFLKFLYDKMTLFQAELTAGPNDLTQCDKPYPTYTRSCMSCIRTLHGMLLTMN